MSPATAWDGLIKFKLAHRDGASVLIPDALIGGANYEHWIQPQYFYAPYLALNAGEARLRIAVVDPAGRDDSGLVCDISFNQAGRVGGYSDGSQLYRCHVESEGQPAELAVGHSRYADGSGLQLKCFHHTSSDALAAIQASSTLRGSSWNFQGTRKLTNVQYVYLTCLPRIRSAADLQKIAMASEGQIGLRLDQNVGPRPDVVINVYRENTANRQHTLALWMPAELISPSHVWLHSGWIPTTYEVANPWILRVGLEPGREMRFANGIASPRPEDLRTFSYVVIGPCTTPEGLAAPYDEEITTQTFNIQHLEDADLFEVWRKNANQSLFRPPTDRQRFQGDEPLGGASTLS